MSSPHSWPKKFAFAISGILWSARNQNSFWIHLPITVAVISLAAWLRIDPWRWVAVLFAITIVWSVELLNTSIELLVKVLHPEHDERIGQALDAAAGAVLVSSIGAVIIGLIVLGLPLLRALAFF
jgi:diacylglycerol kinase